MEEWSEKFTMEKFRIQIKVEKAWKIKDKAVGVKMRLFREKMM